MRILSLPGTNRLAIREPGFRSTLSSAADVARSGAASRPAPGPFVSRISADQGFTLIELLIALAIVGLITLLLFSGLRLGSRAWESVEAASDRTAEIRLARNLIERALTQIRAANVTIDGESVPVFAGDAERLELVAPLSEHVGVPGLYILRLTIEESRGHRDLVLTRWLLHPEVLEGRDDIPPWEPLEKDSGIQLGSAELDKDSAAGAFGRNLLLEDVDLFQIAYFGAVEGEDVLDWYDEWVGQPRLPRLLRIRLTSVRQTWPDLIVALPEVAD